MPEATDVETLRMMTHFAKLPSAVRLVEVGPRDGLQNEAAVVETRAKLAFIEALADAGLSRIEIKAAWILLALGVPAFWAPRRDPHELAKGIE